tara:strand:+ start:16761 stop:17693 length:933 start_codon:yes stop_codon:yes gene_type:complete
MTTEITTYKNITPAQVDLIKSQIAVGASDDELKLFLHVADKSSLDPLSRQIYFIKRSGKMTIQTGIDGFRAVADRTGQYVGSSDPVFEDNGNIPAKATVTVNKVVGGIVGNFTATARWQEYYPGKSQGFMWDKMPHTMLGKCAEALALRKAFPAQLSGLYTGDEMDQAGDQGIPNNTKDINPKGGSKQLEELLVVPEPPENKVNSDETDKAYQVAEKELDEGFAFCADKNIHDNIINHLNDIKYEETPQSMEVLNNFATSHPENQTKFQDIAREKNKEWQSNLSEDGYTQLRAWMVTLNNFFTLTQEEIA